MLLSTVVFWQCMDTLRDKELLEKSVRKKKHL